MSSMDLFGPPKAAGISKQEKVNFKFLAVIDQEKAKRLLQKALLNKRLPKAYLFTGPQGVGKDAMAIEFAKALNCTSTNAIPCQTCTNCRLIGQLVHPDFKFIFAAPAKLKEEDHVKHINAKAENYYLQSAYSETAEILIDQIRQLKKLASMKLYQGKHRVFIISEADRLRTEAANSLLKILEEPPEQLLIILTTSRLDKILPTILSRCQVIKFSPLSDEAINQKLIEQGAEKERAQVISRLSMGNFQKAQKLLEEDYLLLREQAWALLQSSQSPNELEKLELINSISTAKDRGQIKELLQLALLWLRDLGVLQTDENNSGRQRLLYNGDNLEKLQQLQQVFNGINLDKTIIETENCIDLVEKNVYIVLILINYVNHLFEMKL